MTPSILSANGFTVTADEVHAWVGRLVAHVRDSFRDASSIEARVWGYRHHGINYLSCDLWSGEDSLPVTICVDGRLELPALRGGAAEADAPDLAEALHWVGMLTQALNAKVVIGLTENETNPRVLGTPLQVGQTNGPLNLWRDATR